MKNTNRIWIYTLNSLVIFFMFLSISFNSIAQESSIIVKDIDGNVYKTVQIGNQLWMAENLKTTKLNDGTPIPNITDNAEWSKLLTTGYCWYENNLSNKNQGAIFTWITVYTDKLCPSGWHVPSRDEWNILFDYLGGNKVAGGKLKADTSLWWSPNSDAMNESGFTVLPYGIRREDGKFTETGKNAAFWTSTTPGNWNKGPLKGIIVWSAEFAYSQQMAALMFFVNSGSGEHVRCIKD